MKTIEIKTNIENPDAEIYINALIELGFKQYNPKDKDATFDFYGVRTFKNIVYIDCKDEETFRKISNSKYLRYISARTLHKADYDFTFFNLRKRIESAKNIEEKLDLILMFLGLKERKAKEVLEIPFRKKTLTDLERAFLTQVLDKWGIPFSFTIHEDKLIISFSSPLPDEYKEEIARDVNIWSNKDELVELNFDIDTEDKDILLAFIDKLKKKIPDGIFQIRKSSHRGYHIREIGRLYTPLEALTLRENLGDSKFRLQWDKLRIEHGLKSNFLYDIKYGKKAGKWIPINKFLEECK